MKNTVKNYILSQGLLHRGDRVLCALSGGGDSVVMTRILAELAEELGISVSAAHLNHGIRGTEAERDQLFSEKLCRELHITFFTETLDIPKLARESGEGLEECARRYRYEFLLKCAEKNSINKIATAHHSTDNTETVIFHLLRGSSIGGLSGIAPIRKASPESKVCIIRPLLACSKNDIETYLNENSISFVTDTTNSDTTITRNFIRADILPKLRKLNASVDSSVLRLSESARTDEEYFISEARKLPHDASLALLVRTPEPILRRYVRLLYAEKSSTSAQLEHKHTLELCYAIKHWQKDIKISVPDGLTAVISKSGINFTDGKELPSEPFCIKLSEFGEYDTGSGKIFFSDKQLSAEQWDKKHPTASLCALLIPESELSELYIRSQQEGDKYVRGGMTRIVRKELNRIKYPPDKRPSLPRLCDKDGIIWIPYLLASDRTRSGADTANGGINKIKQLIYIGYTEN